MHKACSAYYPSLAGEDYDASDGTPLLTAAHSSASDSTSDRMLSTSMLRCRTGPSACYLRQRGVPPHSRRPVPRPSFRCRELEREEEAAAAPPAPAGPSEDFTLKAGQTFTIKVAIDGSKGKHTTGVGAPPPALPGALAGSSGSGGVGRLAPPPGGAGLPRLRPPPGSVAASAAARPAPAAAAAAPPAAATGGGPSASAADDLLGLGSAFESGVSLSAAPAAASAPSSQQAAAADPWGF